MSRLTTLAADMVGYRARISAAVAATSGAAKLVPCTCQYPPGRAPTRPSAGADSATRGPDTDPDQKLSSALSPDTATTPGSRAGYHTPWPAWSATFPAHATTTTSCDAA